MPISALEDDSLKKRLQSNVADTISSNVTYVVSTRAKYTVREKTVIFILRFERQINSNQNAKNILHYELHDRLL